MTITCQVCGTANPDGTTYCEGCGVELTNAPAAAPAAAATPVTETTPASPSAPMETPPLEPVAAAPTPLTPPEGAAPSTPVSIEPPVSEGTTAQATPADAVPAPSAEPVVVDAAAVPAAENAPAQAAAPENVHAEAAHTDAAPVVAAAPAAPAAPAPAASGEAKLGIKKFGAATGEFIPLNGEKLVVGRFDASTGPVDIDLSGLAGQEHISRRHAELYRENGTWHVRDLGSTNGVYVKHKNESSFSPRLQEPAALADGDEIAFGNLMLTFHQG